ncbi:helix-turn-helix transcriptional regulator [Lentzea sp. NPDC005914]|uniref:helix-turn-helix domain-containing protein n=1 Tax=Lentzea sp. NPDC005914 TaxID=3154572 RepID=UPI0034077F62
MNASRVAPVLDGASPLRALRVAHGLSLGEAGKRAALDPAHLSRVERGLAGVSVDALVRLARVYGLADLAKLLAPYARDGRS